MSPVLRYGFAIPAVIVGLDQLSKWWVTRFFGQPMDICASEPSIRLAHDTTPVIDLALFCNQGISFGLLGGDSSLKRWALTFVALAVCALLGWSLREVRGAFTRWGTALIIGGAIGNAIDRALYGAVTDFIDATDLVPFFGYIFNVADSAITVGVVMLLIGAVLEGRADKGASADF